MPSTSLATGYLPTTQGVIYSAVRPVAIRSINLHSTHADAQTVDICLRMKGEASVVIRRVELEQYYSAEVVENVIDLSTGDTIEALTTTASAVQFWISGLLREHGV